MKAEIINFPLQTHIPEDWLSAIGGSVIGLEAVPLEAIKAAQVRHKGELINGRQALHEIVKRVCNLIHKIDTEVAQ